VPQIGGRGLIFDGSGGSSIDGGTGNSTIYGGAGNDTLSAANGNNLIYTGGGTEAVTDSCRDDENRRASLLQYPALT
jgi:Ca2+-binding RTX toxin-like protein